MAPGWSVAPGAQQVPLPTSDWQTGDMSFALNGKGTLVADGDCIRFRLSSPYAGSLVTPVWPAGTIAYRQGDQITVYDAAGNAVARTGDSVDYAGGFGPAPYASGCTAGQTSFWLVQEDLARGY